MIIKNNNSEKFIEELSQHEYVNKHIKKLRDHHEDSAEHCFSVGVLAVDLGYENNLPLSDLRVLGMAGLLHDLGKHDIDDEILSKSGILNKKEKEKIQHHPRLGFLRMNDKVFKKIKEIIIGHHEYKLLSYPRKKINRREEVRGDIERRNSDKKTVLLTKILTVADMFDALANKRSYKEPFLRDDIEKIMREQFVSDNKLIDQILHRF